jgi:hypothetical protein
MKIENLDIAGYRYNMLRLCGQEGFKYGVITDLEKRRAPTRASAEPCKDKPLAT